MSTQKHIKQYLEQLARHYAAGHATEHTYRPALQALLESVIPGVLVTNEPKQIDCGAPDFVLTRNHIPLGYVEAKDIDKNLDDKIHHAQLARYTESLDNLLFTNYREFRLFRNAKRVATVTIAECRDRRIKPASPNLAAFAAFTDILTTFAGYEGQTITTAADLAARMAVKARMMAEVITQALERDGGELRTLHLFESPTLDTLITGYPETGDHIITKPEYKITDAKKTPRQCQHQQKTILQQRPRNRLELSHRRLPTRTKMAQRPQTPRTHPRRHLPLPKNHRCPV